MQKIFIKSLLIIILLTAVFILPKIYPVGPVVYFRLFLLFLILILCVSLFRNIFIDNPKNKIASNAGTVLFSLFVTFIFLETIFMFVPRSNPAFNSLATNLWYYKYFRPVNSLGFRDKETPLKIPAGGRVILFVGDSFTVGDGLESADYRFSDIVGKELNKNGNNYTVINIGVEGLSSRQEYFTMTNYFYMTKIKPDIIVLQYFGNDIRDYVPDSVKQEKIDLFNLFGTNSFLLSIIRGSYLLDYIYWTYHRNTFAPHAAKLMQFYMDTYKNDDIFSKHQNDLMKFVKYAKDNSARLIVVVFPYLEAVEISDSVFAHKIAGFFQANHADVVNVSGLVKNMPVSERIVSGYDAHASRKVNKMVADEILKILRQEQAQKQTAN